jgi:hypothetical protein
MNGTIGRKVRMGNQKNVVEHETVRSEDLPIIIA